MRTLLVLPRFVDNIFDAYDIPLGILYISSALKQGGKEVHCLNLNHIEGGVEHVVAQAVKEIDPDVCAAGGI
ncbi:MAG: hypothetical protein HQL69_01110 [Magnetococcales bacterium]|nr:hypothetical protein [Magnetococcales bacterium]